LTVYDPYPLSPCTPPETTSPRDTSISSFYISAIIPLLLLTSIITIKRRLL
ncbi:unnamed protein product, partial [marine sediment metagenome]